jgi:hypothetical protein
MVTDEAQVDDDPLHPALVKMFDEAEIVLMSDGGATDYELSPQLLLFYMDQIEVEESSFEAICQLTMGQSECPDWYLQRKLRISASRANKIHRAKKNETRMRYFFESGIDHPNLSYGREMEDIARRKYMELTGYETVQCGLVVSKNYHWLCGSPDGLVLNSKRDRFLLEIKCPVSCKDSKIVVPYVKDSKLKESHEYFAQVQILMYFCKVEKCHLFIFSSEDYLLLEIALNKAYL